MPSSEPPREKLVYANWARLNGTPYDVALEFGYRTGEGPPKESDVHVVMTWEEAKDILLLLSNAVSEYEKMAGSIREFGSEVTQAVQPGKPPPQRRKRK